MKRLLLAALALTSPIFVNPGMAAAPAAAVSAAGRWEAVPLPDEVEDAPLALAWSRSDPSIVYGRGRRTLWRSEDGGRSWTATGFMGDEDSYWWDYPGWGQAVAVDAGDPRIVYVRSTAIATGPIEARVGFYPRDRVRGGAYVSRDGGATWRDLNCLHVAVDPVRPGRVYGVSAALQLQLSDDSGRTWRDLGFGHGRLANGLHAYVSVADPHRILIGSPGYRTYHSYRDAYGLEPPAPAVLWHSADGGDTWAALDLGRGFDQLTVDSHAVSRLYGTVRDSLFVSDDGGVGWRLLHRFRFPIRRLFSRPEEGRVAAGSSSYFWTSDDGGETWQGNDAPSVITDLAFDPSDPSRLLAASRPYDRAHLFESRDGSRSWSPTAPPQLPPPVGTVEVGPGGRLWVGAAADRDGESRLPVLYVRDGRVWQRRGATADLRVGGRWGPVHGLFIDPQNPEAMLADFAGPVVRSEDGGRTWRATGAEAGPYCRGPVVFRAQPDWSGWIYARGEGLLRSTDAGLTWQGVPETNFLTVGLEPSLTETGAVIHATDRRLLRTVPGRDSPEEVSTVPDRGYLVALLRHPLSPQQLISVSVVGEGFAVHAVEDDGRGWRRLGQFEGTFPVAHFSVSGLSVEDKQWRWDSHGIARLRFHPTDPDVFYLVFRRDLLVTRDGGHTWQRIEDGPTSVPWYTDVAVDPDAPDDLYVGTPLGLYRLRGAINTAVAEDRDATPDAFALGAAYPNPFNAGTVIPVTVPHATHTRVEVHGLLGQRVRVLADGPLGAGTHRLRWNGRDDAGRALGTGVYLVRLRAGAETRAMRVLLLK